MFRKLILTAVLAAAILTTAVGTADASSPTILPHHHFEVLVERGGVWQSRGVYHLQVRAELIAVRLRHEGYKVEIRQF
jgi:hypothetical protein